MLSSITFITFFRVTRYYIIRLKKMFIRPGPGEAMRWGMSAFIGKRLCRVGNKTEFDLQIYLRGCFDAELRALDSKNPNIMPFISYGSTYFFTGR